MSELKQLPRESTLALVEEVKESAQHFKVESQNAQNEIDNLKERKSLLQAAEVKSKSGMATNIIQNMIEEIDLEVSKLEERVHHCNKNNKYYIDVTKALEEALKEFY